MICQYCNQFFEMAVTGRTPRFCSGRCRQAMHRLAKNGFVRQRRSAAAVAMAFLSSRNTAGTGDYRQIDWTV